MREFVFRFLRWRVKVQIYQEGLSQAEREEITAILKQLEQEVLDGKIVSIWAQMRQEFLEKQIEERVRAKREPERQRQIAILLKTGLFTTEESARAFVMSKKDS